MLSGQYDCQYGSDWVIIFERMFKKPLSLEYLTMQRSHRFLLLLTLLLGGMVMAAFAEDRYEKDRLEMVRLIEADVRRTSLLLDRKELDDHVMAALKTVPRHLFVPARQQPYAYENRPLPIGHGQTISQPYMVAVMTDLLKPKPSQRILEVGTGSGYQAAILSELVEQVYSLEIIAPLGELAAERLNNLGYGNIEVRLGDGYYGWEEHAPFDAIVVTAAASHIPPPLLAQLRPGGRMVIPVGSRFWTQQLLLVEKDHNGALTTRQVLPVAFVPLTGGHKSE